MCVCVCTRTQHLHSELYLPPPPGSLFCRTLGGGYNSWPKLSTTSDVSSRFTPSRMRRPTSGGETMCKCPAGRCRTGVCLPHLASCLFLPPRRLFLCSAATDGSLAFWDLTNVLDHGSTALEPPADNGLPYREYQPCLSVRPTSHLAFSPRGRLSPDTVFSFQGWAPPA